MYPRRLRLPEVHQTDGGDWLALGSHVNSKGSRTVLELHGSLGTDITCAAKAKINHHLIINCKK